MARHKRKGSSRAGRPKQKGDRYACGKLKPKGPNATVLAKRQAGDAAAGEHPLDFALSKGWLTERQHKDAMAYRSAFNRAHIGGPRLSLGTLSETPPSEELRETWATMTDAEITAIFDKVFDVDPEALDPEKAEERALARWRLLNAGLSASEREELFRVAVLGSWPFWMPKKAADHALGIKDIVKEQTLLSSLAGVARAMRPPRKSGGRIIPLPDPPMKRADRAEQDVFYETQDGQPITPMSERGRPFEVTILRKRA